jgi:activator of HSP90 ATPase
MKKAAKSPKPDKAPPTLTIRHSVAIAATPVEVYDALVNAKKHAAFTGAAAKSSHKVGGKFTAWDGYISGKYLNLVAGRKIVEEWSTNEWPAGYAPSLIELAFERAEHGTRLKMVQTRVPANQTAEYRQGWKDYYWTPLKKHFLAKQKAAQK